MPPTAHAQNSQATYPAIYVFDELIEIGKPAPGIHKLEVATHSQQDVVRLVGAGLKEIRRHVEPGVEVINRDYIVPAASRRR